MRRVIALCLLLCTGVLIFMMSCSKQKVVESCPVVYSIDTEHEYALVDKWQFVGFENTATGELESPICGNVESWISFTDSLSTAKSAAINHFDRSFEGVALINHFSGTYHAGDNGELQVSPTIKTTVRGTEQVKAFESKFHHLLDAVNSYEISHNELILKPEGSDIVLRFVAE